jgi:hypothetical protein
MVCARTESLAVHLNKRPESDILPRSVNVENLAVRDQMDSGLQDLCGENTLRQILNTIRIFKAEGTHRAGITVPAALCHPFILGYPMYLACTSVGRFRCIWRFSRLGESTTYAPSTPPLVRSPPPLPKVLLSLLPLPPENPRLGPKRPWFWPQVGPNFWGEPLSWHSFFGHSFRFRKSVLASPSRRRGLGKGTAFESLSPAVP